MKATRGKAFTFGWSHGLAAVSTLVLFACGGGGSDSPAGSNGIDGPMGNAGDTAGGGASGSAGAGVVGPASGGAPDSMPPGGASGVTPDVGSKAIHRLSGLEYDNTVRDLLGTQLKPSTGFQDDTEALGFTNIADALAMNPRSVKDYYDAAISITDELTADAARLATIVTCQPAAAGDPACANQIIAAFGLRAFRRPLDPAEATHYAALYQTGLTNGLDHAGAIAHVVRAMLTAPQFLYRMEFDSDPVSPEQHALNAYELASRMSYMMWSSMPDQTLFDLAGNGQLLQLDTLQAQVDRMLQDPKSSTLVDSFTWQWFGAPRLADHDVNLTQYPMWDETLRASMQNELRMFLDEFVHGTRAFPEILTADVNFVDAKLAEVYGMPAPASGTERIEFTTDERKGILGLAGFLTHTSRHNRTAPTIRAAWVLNSLWCMDLAPPTNIVITPLPEVDPNVTSVRELIEAHRNNPACSVCHDIVDPVGLGMEQYDAIGRFRQQYENGDPIDTAGTLPGNVAFTGFADMLDKIAVQATTTSDPANPTLKTVDCAVHKAFTYSLGRSIGVSGAYLEQMVTQWKGQPLTLGNLFKQLVVNDVFRFRHGTPDAM